MKIASVTGIAPMLRDGWRYTPWCTMVYVARTNIEIDDELIARAMEIHRVTTKREAVDLALRRLVGEPMGRDEALALHGSGWDGDLDELRAAPGSA